MIAVKSNTNNALTKKIVIRVCDDNRFHRRMRMKRG